MKSTTLISLLLIFAFPVFASLNPFEVDLPPLTEEERETLKKEEALIHEQIDFESLRDFVVKEAKKKATLSVGDKDDRLTIELSEYLPSEKWKRSEERKLVYSSEHWFWELKENIHVSFFYDYSIRLEWEIELMEKNKFSILKESIEDLRYVVY